MKIEYHPATVDDLKTAEIYYQEQPPRLAQAFKAEVLESIDRIRKNPCLYTEINDVRRALLRRFLFSVVYRILSNDTIRILLIRHHKRHPVLGSEIKENSFKKGYSAASDRSLRPI